MEVGRKGKRRTGGSGFLKPWQFRMQLCAVGVMASPLMMDPLCLRDYPRCHALQTLKLPQFVQVPFYGDRAMKGLPNLACITQSEWIPHL